MRVRIYWYLCNDIGIPIQSVCVYRISRLTFSVSIDNGYSFKFHLYTLEGTPHPQASVTTLSAQPPTVSLHPTSPLSWDWAIVHISGSTLVVLLCSQRGSGCVLIWDWRKGIPLVVSQQSCSFQETHPPTLYNRRILHPSTSTTSPSSRRIFSRPRAPSMVALTFSHFRLYEILKLRPSRSNSDSCIA